MRACASPLYKRVVAVLGAQMGKTESVFNVMGHRLDDDPTPMLYIGPTQKLVESVSNDRFLKMLQSAARLWERLAKGKRNKITEKFIAGVRLGFGWAGSATELSSHPAGLVIVDERDRMEAVKGEGDPVELADARTANFPDGRVCIVSTPTVGNVTTKKNEESGLEHWEVSDQVASPIWQLWQEGTRLEWTWPCPDCGEYFIPRFRHLTWPEGCTPQRARKEARLCCPNCGSLIDEPAKVEMNARGVFVAPGQKVAKDGTVSGAQPESDTASFWVSGLCSPWRSFGQRARAYLTAVKSGAPSRVQAVVNTGMAELYASGGDAPDWKEVAELREGYAAGTVPEGVQRLTCFVDVQKNRLIYAVRGWGWNMESWLIEAGDIWGETEHDAVWGELAKLLDREFADKRIQLMLVDSGYNPSEKDRNPDNQIYLFCRRHRGRAYPTKGHDTQDKPYKASKIDVSFRGKIFKNGLDLWHLDTDYFKSWVHARLEWPKGEAGGWHLPSDVTDDYCQQIVAEHRATNPAGKVQWIRIRRENHFLDCESGNAAAAHILRLHGLPKPKEAPAGTEDSPPSAPQQEAVAKHQPAAQRRRVMAPPRRNWTTGWRR